MVKTEALLLYIITAADVYLGFVVFACSMLPTMYPLGCKQGVFFIVRYWCFGGLVIGRTEDDFLNRKSLASVHPCCKFVGARSRLYRRQMKCALFDASFRWSYRNSQLVSTPNVARDILARSVDKVPCTLWASSERPQKERTRIRSYYHSYVTRDDYDLYTVPPLSSNSCVVLEFS